MLSQPSSCGSERSDKIHCNRNDPDVRVSHIVQSHWRSNNQSCSKCISLRWVKKLRQPAWSKWSQVHTSNAKRSPSGPSRGYFRVGGGGWRGLNRSRKCKSSSGVTRACSSEKVWNLRLLKWLGMHRERPSSCTLSKRAIIKESKLKVTRGIIINPLVLKHLRHITKLDAWQHQLSLSLCFTHITVNTIKILDLIFIFSLL